MTEILFCRFAVCSILIEELLFQILYCSCNTENLKDKQPIVILNSLIYVAGECELLTYRTMAGKKEDRQIADI